MANKRETSAQRRQRENRARRAALEARTKGTPSRPSRVAPATADKLATTRAAASEPATKGAKGSARATDRAGRPKREKPPKPGDKPVDIDTLEGNFFRKAMQVPGGLQAMFAGAMAIVASGLLAFTNTAVSVERRDAFEAAKKNIKNAKPDQTIFERYPLKTALPLVVIPLVIALVAVAFSTHRQRRRVWMVATVVLAAIALTAAQYYLFVSGFFAYACFRASKIEGPGEPLFGRSRRTRSSATAADDEAGDADEADEATESERA